jgi:hypothetical protein
LLLLLCLHHAGKDDDHHDDDDEDEYEHSEEKDKNNCMCKRRRNGRSKRAYGGGCECPKSGVLSQGPVVLGGNPMGWKCACVDNKETPTKVNVICDS